MSPPDSSYAGLQARFAGALLDATESPAAAAQFVGENASVERRLALYRGNVLAARGKALLAAYPVVSKIVGEDFFLALTRRYMQSHPATSGDLNEFGEKFSDFLRDFPAVVELPYLADVARLEWAIHRAHYAADSATLALEELVNTRPEHQALLHFEFQAAFALLHSDFPVARIWAVHQDDYPGVFEVVFDEGPHYAMVYRPQWRVKLKAIDAGQYAFLLALKGGAGLGGAFEQALAQQEAFDLGTALAQAVEAGLFTACHVGDVP